MSEPYRYGIYEKALFKKPLPQLLEDAARAGFDNFELSRDETDERLGRLDWDWAERSSFLRRTGLQHLLQRPAPFPHGNHGR